MRLPRSLLVAALLAVALLLPAQSRADDLGASNPPGTLATRSALGGCMYFLAGITVKDGQQVGLTCDATGALRITGNLTLSGPITANQGTPNAGGALAWPVNCVAGCAGGTQGNESDAVAGVATGLGQTQDYPYLWNGTTFDRWYGDKTSGAWVSIKASISLPVTGTFWQATQPVSGTFWQATQPVSAVSLPLPTNAAQETGGNLATIATNTGNTATSTATTATNTGTTATNTGTTATNTGNTATNTSTIAGAVSSSVMQSNTKQVNGTTVLVGTGAVGTGSQRVAVGTDTATIAGSAPGTAGTASANVLSVQGVASMTPVANNQTQVNGTTLLAGTGAQGAGSPRVTVATDTATVAGSAPGTAGTASANVVTVQGVASMTPVANNQTQVNGTTLLAGTGAQGAGSPRVTVATDSATIAGSTPDACTSGTKGYAPFSLASTTALKVVTKSTGKNVYVCSINIVVATANNVALIAGTKVTNDCDTSTAGLAGGTTAATGWNFAANGGLTQGNGMSSVAATASTGLDVCLLASGAGQVSGVLTYVQQ